MHIVRKVFKGLGSVIVGQEVYHTSLCFLYRTFYHNEKILSQYSLCNHCHLRKGI